ncbi:hypothetical protein GMD78_18885 [Ornithinibacillus sp. L9]|uniref:Uncharacterized protein n=1 Tax=Ornithinibacillus caprae TaxID=2678566 RepID=A0A6N8FQQ7_9BACI|nr:hypothetical protein [Ornithinibacillus caprae]MUK90429.1 hypothetical protein [Ornithinibacillus caprae]
MNRWFYFNLTVLIVAAWQVFQTFPSIPTHVLVGFIGLCFVLFNWTRHAVFSTIRNTTDRKRKIKLANISKKIMPFHRWIGTSALVIISVHALLVLDLFGFNWRNLKVVSGLLAGLILIAMVTTGWMRLVRPTGRKRKAHLYIGLSLFCFIAIHILL